MTRQTRRTVLSSVAGAIALAGCSETELGGRPDKIERVAVDGTRLLIELDSPAADHSLSVIDPTGELFAEVSLSAGETRIPIELGLDYTPGEFEIHLSKEGNPQESTSFEVQPKLDVVDIGIGANHLDRMPGGLGNVRKYECFVEVRNTGNGPTAIQGLGFRGDIPNPTDLDGADSGIYDAENNFGQLDRVIVAPQAQTTLFSNSFPLMAAGGGFECQDESFRGDLIIQFIGTNLSVRVERFNLRYAASESDQECTPEIVSGGS